ARFRIAAPIETRVAVDPEPRRLCGLAFAFSHEQTIAAPRSAPIHKPRAIFGAMIAILPEGFALSRASPTVIAWRACCKMALTEQEARQIARQRERFEARGIRHSSTPRRSRGFLRQVIHQRVHA